MGFVAMNAALHHSQATGTDKLVLVAIASFYDDQGDNGAYPSQETIARMANCTVRTVQRSLARLVELGELDTWVHGGRGKSIDRKTNRYWLTVQCPDNCDSSFNHRIIDDAGDQLTRHARPTDPTPVTNSPDADVVLTIMNNHEQPRTVITEPRRILAAV